MMPCRGPGTVDPCSASWGQRYTQHGLDDLWWIPVIDERLSFLVSLGDVTAPGFKFIIGKGDRQRSGIDDPAENFLNFFQSSFGLELFQ